MTEKTPQNLNVILQSVRQGRLTKEQVFRLWRSAVKDEDRLLDATIEQLCEGMIAFDLARAETVIRLIIERDEAAAPTFRSLLQEILPKAGRSDRTPSLPAMQHLQELGMPRELIRPIISINRTNETRTSMPKPMQEYIIGTVRKPASGLGIKCPHCKARSVFHRAKFPRIDSSGFETYSFQCRNCGVPLVGIIDPFDGTLLLSLLWSASSVKAVPNRQKHSTEPIF